MKITIKKSLLGMAVSSVLVSPVVNATNGYFMHGVSTKEKGLAGAGAAYSQDAMAAATNPAGMAFVGERFDVGGAIFSPSPRSFTVTGQPQGSPFPPGPNTFINAVPDTEYESDADFFFIPHIGYNWQFEDGKALGISIYGNGGMNTDYPASATPGGAGTFGAGRTGINLEQAFFNLSFANKLDEKHAIGASLLLVGQKFSAEGLDGFGALGASLDPANLTSGDDSEAIGVGVKIGYQGEVSDGFRVGVSYQSKVRMDEFDEYKGLFAGAGDFDIPATYTLGVSFDVGDSGKVVADVQEIKYSGVASVSNPLSNLFACMGGDPSSCLGGANGPGFGWEDMTVVKIGYQFDAGNSTYRIGYSHADQVIPEGEVFFNILAPAVIEDHITAGWTLRLGKDQEINIAGMYAPEESVKGPNPFDGGSTQIEIEMSQWEIQAGWALKY